MKSILFAFLAVFLLFTGCGPVKVNKPEPAKQTEKSDSVQIVKTDSTEITAPDSSLLAYGNLFFGMKKAEVERKNESRQQLGKYEYNFNYSFNGDSGLYRVIIKSDGVKVVTYDTELSAMYRNLAKIVETRYGEPEVHLGFPSVFDVQNSHKYKLDEWNNGAKQIQISMVENNLNSYSVVCEITHQKMAETETTRQKNFKNKDVIDAAKKF
jgi:hypothetical protein